MRLSHHFYDEAHQDGLLQRDAVNCYHLVDLLIADGSLTNTFITDHVHDISYQSITQSSSQTYLGAGGLLGITNIGESTAVRVNSLTLTLAGVDEEFVSKIMASTQLINKRVVIYRSIGRGVFESPSSSNTFILYDGLVKDFSIEEGVQDAKISLALASHWADFDKKTGRITNPQSQGITKKYNSTQLFEGDKGFEFASSLIGDIKWGPKN